MKIFNFNPLRNRQNKRFNYTPRYYNGKSINNKFEIDSKINKFREAYNKNDFSNNWNDIRLEKRTRKNFSNSPLLIIIFCIGLLENGSPLFVQKRVGQNFKSFLLIKFRTMPINTRSTGTHLINDFDLSIFYL